MIVQRDQVHPEGDSRRTSPLLLRPMTPVVREPSAPDRGDRMAGSSIFANQGYFYAQCRPSDAVGSCVYANSTEAFVSTADEASPNPVIGIIVAKQNATNCTVQRYGQSMVEFSGLITGRRYFLGPAGSIIAPPFTDEMPEYVQQVGNAISPTLLFVQPTGQVIRRIINRDFVLMRGTGTPQNNRMYDRTDVYVDRVGLAAYLSPTVAGEDSIILMGDGPPSEDQVRDAQALYRGDDGQLYFAGTQDAAPAGVSRLFFGSGEPSADIASSQNVFYLESTALSAYPRENTQGAT